MSSVCLRWVVLHPFKFTFCYTSLTTDSVFFCISLPHSFHHASSRTLVNNGILHDGWYSDVQRGSVRPAVTRQQSCVRGAVKKQTLAPLPLQRCHWPHSRWWIGAGKDACVCNVCRWAFGEGWIMAKVMIMVAKQQHFWNTSLGLRWWMGFPSFLSCFEHRPSFLRHPDGQRWRRYTSSSSRFPMLWWCSGTPAIGLLHMGQTQRTSSHFTRHLCKRTWNEMRNSTPGMDTS